MRGGRCIRLLVDPPCRPSPLLSPPFTLELWPHTCPGPAAPHPFLCVCYFFWGGWQVAAKGKGIISNQFLDRVDQAWYNRSAKFDRGAKLQVYRCHYYGTSTVEGNDFEEAEEMVGLCL